MRSSVRIRVRGICWISCSSGERCSSDDGMGERAHPIRTTSARHSTRAYDHVQRSEDVDAPPRQRAARRRCHRRLRQPRDRGLSAGAVPAHAPTRRVLRSVADVSTQHSPLHLLDTGCRCGHRGAAPTCAANARRNRVSRSDDTDGGRKGVPQRNGTNHRHPEMTSDEASSLLPPWHTRAVPRRLRRRTRS